MKKPSRYMPKYKNRKTNYLDWVFLICVFILSGWLIWSLPYLLLLVFILVFITVIDNKKRIEHFNILIQNRQNDSICTFSRYFRDQKIDTWVIRAVYEQLQSYVDLEKANFPIRPSDDVYNDLQIDDEDFWYIIIEEIAERTGRSLENAESNPYYEKANIVENLVYFFNGQPKNVTQ